VTTDYMQTIQSYSACTSWQQQYYWSHLSRRTVVCC